MATASKLKIDIKKLKAAISSKATPKSFIPKLKAQLGKVETELAKVQASGKPSKPSQSTAVSTLTTLQKLKKLIKENPKFAVYRGAGVDLEKDAKEGALSKGRRISQGLKGNQFTDKKSAKGHVYYEYRANHLDVKQPKKAQKYPKLEAGGFLGAGQFAKGGGIDNNYLGKSAEQIWNGWTISQRTHFLHDHIKMDKKYIESAVMLNEISLNDWNKIPSNIKKIVEEHISTGQYAKGGEIKPYIVWVSKDGNERKLIGEYKSQRAAQMALNKLWQSDENYHEVGYKSKETYEKEGIWGYGGEMSKKPKVTRTQFEEDEFEFAHGGELHRTQQ